MLWYLVIRYGCDQQDLLYNLRIARSDAIYTNLSLPRCKLRLVLFVFVTPSILDACTEFSVSAVWARSPPKKDIPP